MLNVNEEQIMTCIRLSADYQIQYLKNHSSRYDELTMDVLGVLQDIKHTGLSFKQVLVLPFVFLLITAFLLFTISIIPFMVFLDFIDRFKAIKKLRQNKRLSASDYDGSLNDLWYQFGVNKRHPNGERIEVLQHWITVLYPITTVNSLNINSLLEATYTRQYETRKRMKVTCVLFTDALDNVVEDISNDFPLYVD